MSSNLSALDFAIGTVRVAGLVEQWVTAQFARGEISAVTAKGRRSHLRPFRQATRVGVSTPSPSTTTSAQPPHLVPPTRRLRYSTASAFLTWAFQIGAVTVDLIGMLPTARVPRAVPR